MYLLLIAYLPFWFKDQRKLKYQNEQNLLGKSDDQDKFIPVYYFFLMALIDVHATLLIVNSFLYTSITSVMLLEDASIPCVFLLSIFFLKINYGCKHYLAIVLCFCGLSCSISNDLFIKNKADNDSSLPI